MKISVCLDRDDRIVGLCPDDLSGCTGWRAADTDALALTLAANLFDEAGNPLYRLRDGVATRTPPAPDSEESAVGRLPAFARA